MKLLNVGCGGNRPQDEFWWNIDHLNSFLKRGTPERNNLDKEPRYIDHDLAKPMPFPLETFDGILCSHVIEHFPAHSAVSLLEDCRLMLKPGGLIVVSVPGAEYFLKVYDQDTPENALELFGEPISADEPWQKSFFDYALFHREHQQVLTEGSLQCLLLKAGLRVFYDMETALQRPVNLEIFTEIQKIMNRRKFSVELVAIKSASA